MRYFNTVIWGMIVILNLFKNPSHRSFLILGAALVIWTLEYRINYLVDNRQ